MKKDITRVKRLQLHRESIRGLDLRTAAGGTTQASSHPDCTFIYTGCLPICRTTV